MLELYEWECADCGKKWQDFTTVVVVAIVKVSGKPVLCDACADRREKGGTDVHKTGD